MSRSSTAVYSPTGMVINPKVIAPFHTERLEVVGRSSSSSDPASPFLFSDPLAFWSASTSSLLSISERPGMSFCLASS